MKTANPFGIHALHSYIVPSASISLRGFLRPVPGGAGIIGSGTATAPLQDIVRENRSLQDFFHAVQNVRASKGGVPPSGGESFYSKS
jgi:hypothetical protein